VGALPKNQKADKWQAELPIPEVATPLRSAGGNGPVEYDVAMRQVMHAFHPKMSPMKVWTYGDTFPGLTIEGRVGMPSRVTWRNELQGCRLDDVLEFGVRQGMEEEHMLSVSHNQIHLHGARVPSSSDGNPMAPFHPHETRGYYYPNDQRAATLWYHDHTMDVTRLNVYAGLAGMYLLREDDEADVLPVGDFEIPLLLQDRTFNQAGSKLFYDQPFVVDNGVVTDASMPEFAGAYPVVNGAIWPRLTTPPTMHRFRVLNGANSRFFTLTLVDAADATATPLPFTVIGTDGGFVPSPIIVSTVTVSPGERLDLLVDLAKYPGKHLIVRNTAAIPYPGDALTADDNCAELLQIQVAKTVKSSQKAAVDANNLKFAGGVITLPTPTAHNSKGDPIKGSCHASVAVATALNAEINAFPLGIAKLENDVVINGDPYKIRRFTLEEIPMPMATLLATDIKDAATNQLVPDALKTSPSVVINGQNWQTAAPVVVKKDSVEVWDFVNNSPDTHPMHLHLVEFELIGRKNLNPADPANMPTAIEPYEQGPKDTVQCNPGQSTRILVKFSGYVGEYVYHCHILEHEDMGMMFQLHVEA
jgi:spore coat protein A, manganese oxidase